MSEMDTRLFMVFDVESVGLHGEGFSVGHVLIDRQGREQGNSYFGCSPDAAAGPDDGREWVAANVPPPGSAYYHGGAWYNCTSPREVRDRFWSLWTQARQMGATLWADCAWPVEARFLAACVDDDPAGRTWTGPYPLHDVTTLRLAAGFDPLATVDRLPGELPVHDPSCDARQSARLLIEALNVLQGKV